MSNIIKAIDIAKAHQRAMLEYRAKIQTEASCIGKLMVGRQVRVHGQVGEFTITESRLGLGAQVTFFGKRLKGSKGRPVKLGFIGQLEIVEPAS